MDILPGAKLFHQGLNILMPDVLTLQQLAKMKEWINLCLEEKYLIHKHSYESFILNNRLPFKDRTLGLVCKFEAEKRQVCGHFLILKTRHGII